MKQRFLFLTALLCLSALCPSCILWGGDDEISPEDRDRRRASPERGRRSPPGEGEELPEETDDRTAVVFEMNADGTVATIRSEGAMFVSSDLYGSIVRDGEGRFGILSEDLGEGLTLNFDLGAGSIIEEGEGRDISAGEPVGEGTNEMQMYFEQDGEKISFCVGRDNIVNKRPDLLELVPPDLDCF